MWGGGKQGGGGGQESPRIAEVQTSLSPYPSAKIRAFYLRKILEISVEGKWKDPFRFGPTGIFGTNSGGDPL